MSDTGWIVTYTGRKFYPLDPRIEDIDILDIAHALSNICRFTGHCRQFYSVAQHCVLAAGAAPDWLKLAMLLHDASEAYLCDVSRPVKHSKGMEVYRLAESRLQDMIGQRFGGIHFDDPLVHEIDDRMLMTERRDLTNTIPMWTVHHEPYDWEILPLDPIHAEARFLRMFAAVGPYADVSRAPIFLFP